MHESAHAIEFAEWQVAARNGFVAGGLTDHAAAAVVQAASDDVAPLLLGALSAEFRATFLAACDLEATAYARGNPEGVFLARS